MEKFNNYVRNFISKFVNILKYIVRGIMVVLVAFMLVTPFILKKTAFNGDDLVVFNKNIKVISVEGKVNIRAMDSYIKTGIPYNEYSNYIEKYNKTGLFKKTFILELNTLFILLEVMCLYFLLVNLIKLFIDKEDDDYRLYLVKKSFVINSISFLVFSLVRKFLFRNTIFSTFNLSIFLIYFYSIIMFIVFYRIVEMNKVSMFKGKKNEKNN